MKRPPHPYLVLAAAIALPGAGHVLIGTGRRGLTMQLFMITLGMITWHLTTPAVSLVGRLSGGLFVYALSIPDAYRAARLNWHRAHLVERPDAAEQARPRRPAEGTAR